MALKSFSPVPPMSINYWGVIWFDRYVLPGCHLKLLAPKKKPCRSPDQKQFSKSFSFDDRRRSRSFTSETSDALSTASVPTTGLSRARAGSYSFHGRTKTGVIVPPKCYVVTSTPKVNHSAMHPAESLPKDVSKSPHSNIPRRWVMISVFSPRENQSVHCGLGRTVISFLVLFE